MTPQRVEIVRGDITTLTIDVIVNAANAALSGGGGVDGAIHRAAGPELREECRAHVGAKAGDVVFTNAYKLNARFVAHAVGPVWQGGDKGEDELLARVYRAALDGTVERGATSIAFPSISTGAYRFPIDRAARIALTAATTFLASNTTIARVVFCLFDDADVRVYQRAIARLATS